MRKLFEIVPPFGKNQSDGTTVGNSLNYVMELHLASDFRVFRNRFRSIHTHRLVKKLEIFLFW